MRRRGAVLAGAAGLILSGTSGAAAHAFALRYDLPLPLWLFVVGAGAAVAVSVPFALRTPRSPGLAHRRSLRDLPIVGGLFSRRFADGLGVLSVAAFVFLVAAGFIGTADPFANILPTAVWVVWWVGLAYVSAVAGDLWRVLNPFAVVAGWSGAFARFLGIARPPLRPPRWLGAWPAVALLFAFGWAELVWPENAVPSRLACAMLLYAAVTLAGMALFGRRAWLRRGDAFAIFFGLFARFAPVDPDRLTLRPWGSGLVATRPVSPSMLAFVILALGIVGFDGLSETPLFAEIHGTLLAAFHRSGVLAATGYGVAEALIKTAGLIAMPLVLLAVWLAGSAVGAALVARAGQTIGAMAFARRFVLTLVPIAIAYHLAHYLSYLLVHGQAMIGLVSDPFGFGWNLFGTAGFEADIGVAGARFVWYASVAAIVVGHAVAIRLAHLTALDAFGDRRAAMLSQVPMTVLMIAYTMLSLWMLAQPIVEA